MRHGSKPFTVSLVIAKYFKCVYGKFTSFKSKKIEVKHNWHDTHLPFSFFIPWVVSEEVVVNRNENHRHMLRRAWNVDTLSIVLLSSCADRINNTFSYVASPSICVTFATAGMAARHCRSIVALFQWRTLTIDVWLLRTQRAVLEVTAIYIVKRPLVSFWIKTLITILYALNVYSS